MLIPWCWLQTQVPSVSAVVLELCPGPSAQIVPRCCPPNYPICGSTNAEAQASASQAAQKSFARLSPAHFKLLQVSALRAAAFPGCTWLPAAAGCPRAADMQQLLKRAQIC